MNKYNILFTLVLCMATHTFAQTGTSCESLPENFEVRVDRKAKDNTFTKPSMEKMVGYDQSSVGLCYAVAASYLLESDYQTKFSFVDIGLQYKAEGIKTGGLLKMEGGQTCKSINNILRSYKPSLCEKKYSVLENGDLFKEENLDVINQSYTSYDMEKTIVFLERIKGLFQGREEFESQDKIERYEGQKSLYENNFPVLENEIKREMLSCKTGFINDMYENLITKFSDFTEYISFVSEHGENLSVLLFKDCKKTKLDNKQLKCSHSFSPYWKEKDISTERTEEVYNWMNDFVLNKLKENRVAGISYDSNIFDPVDEACNMYEKGCNSDHASVIVGMRKKGESCQYLLQNSWGNNCDAIQDKENYFCEEETQRIWINEKALAPHVESLNGMKDL